MGWCFQLVCFLAEEEILFYSCVVILWLFFLFWLILFVGFSRFLLVYSEIASDIAIDCNRTWQFYQSVRQTIYKIGYVHSIAMLSIVFSMRYNDAISGRRFRKFWGILQHDPSLSFCLRVDFALVNAKRSDMTWWEQPQRDGDDGWEVEPTMPLSSLESQRDVWYCLMPTMWGPLGS